MKRFATASGESPVLHRNKANLMQGILDEVKASVTILPELQALIPKLQKSEYEQLEENIRKEGCRDALLIWQTNKGMIDGSDDDSPVNILVDGHNRYSICKNHSIDFKVIIREFLNMQAVRDFMINNQLGRRNLTPEQTSYLRGLKYRNERHIAGRPVQEESEDEKSVAQRTQDRLAKEFKVSPRTIHRDREYSEGIDKLTPDLKQEVLSGKQKVAKELIRTIGRVSDIKSPSLSLPDLLAFNEPILSNHTKEFTYDDKAAEVIKQITITVAQLDVNSPNLKYTCNKIITLLKKVKNLKNL
ncbi:ParB N-terminal domain-containing protein [Spirosoma aerophilum]